MRGHRHGLTLTALRILNHSHLFQQLVSMTTKRTAIRTIPIRPVAPSEPVFTKHCCLIDACYKVLAQLSPPFSGLTCGIIQLPLLT